VLIGWGWLSAQDDVGKPNENLGGPLTSPSEQKVTQRCVHFLGHGALNHSQWGSKTILVPVALYFIPLLSSNETILQSIWRTGSILPTPHTFVVPLRELTMST
jgi:hypothetical protein